MLFWMEWNRCEKRSSKLYKETCLNHMGQGRSLHISIEIGEHQVHGLVRGRASRSMIPTNTMRELRLMHLVVGSKSYKNGLSIIT